MSEVGFRPAYTKLCKYCKQVTISLKQEHVGNNIYRWICRNANTGSIHDCRTFA